MFTEKNDLTMLGNETYQIIVDGWKAEFLVYTNFPRDLWHKRISFVSLQP